MLNSSFPETFFVDPGIFIELVIVISFDSIGHFFLFLKSDEAFGFDKEYDDYSSQVHKTVKVFRLFNQPNHNFSYWYAGKYHSQSLPSYDCGAILNRYDQQHAVYHFRRISKQNQVYYRDYGEGDFKSSIFLL